MIGPFNQTILLLLIQMSLFVGIVSAQEKTDDRLKLDPKTVSIKSKVEITGVVTEQKKYSIVATSGENHYDIKIGKETTIELLCPSPIVNLKENKLRIARELTKSGEKQFKEFFIEAPLYLVAIFDHQNQFKRTMDKDPKRLNQFTVSPDKKSLTTKGSEFHLSGELMPGENGRQLKLKTNDATYDILLGKRGTWNGFSQVDLVANETGIQVTGMIDSQNTIEAKKILFWPIVKSDDDNKDPSK